MRAVHLLAASLALSVAPATPLASQTPVGVPSIGSRVRVSTRDRPTRFVGSVVRATTDTLTLSDARGVLRSISVADAGRIELSLGKAGHPKIGAAVGIGLGALAGGILGSATSSDSGNSPLECAGAFYCDRPTRAGRTLGGASLGALIGAGVGTLIGKGIKTDRWITIGASSFQPTASVRPTSNVGAVVSLALRF